VFSYFRKKVNKIITERLEQENKRIDNILKNEKKLESIINKQKEIEQLAHNLMIDNDSINHRYRYLEIRLNGFDNVLASMLEEQKKIRDKIGYL
jgi:hypothetical protein